MILSLSLLQVVILLPISVLLISWLYIQWAYHRQISLARKLPTAIPAYPLIGHLIQMNVKTQAGGLTWKLASGHPSGISCIWLGPVPYIIVNKPEYVKVILNNSNALEKADQYSILRYAFGNGLIAAPVNLWKISRRQIGQLFHSENLQHLLPVMNEHARHLVEYMSEHEGKETFDCEDYAFSISILNTLKLLFGLDVEVDRKSEEIKDFFKNIKILSVQCGERACNPILIPDTTFKLLRKKAFINRETLWRHLKVFTQKSLEHNAKEDSNGQTDHVTTFQDLFNVLKDKDPMFNEEYMMGELLTLIAAGTDTNAITISSCLVALGSHPEIQEKLYQEILSVVGENLDVYPEDIGKMTYLDQVLNETLRCFSTVPLGGRKCNQDIQIGKYTIPMGTTVAISVVGLNNNEDVFPNPRKFDPERFSAENVSKRHSYSFLPFSGGPRNCIGKNYAMLSMKIILVHLLKSYEVKSDVEIKNITFQYIISLMSADGYQISIHKRI